jgi:argininosuccinate lyase
VGRALKMDDQELKTVLSPRHFVQIRSIPGGPSISGMESVVDLMEENLKLITHSLNGLNKKVIESEECLSREFNSLG